MQLLYSKGVKWLIVNEGRGQGRTMIMAMAFVEKAFSHTGNWVEVYDHHSHTQQGNIEMLNMCRQVFMDIDFDGSVYEYNLIINRNSIKVEIRPIGYDE